jgi:predicted HTH transcriptional regulator
MTINMLAVELEINKRNAEKNIKILKDADLIERIGARKNGHWAVKD